MTPSALDQLLEHPALWRAADRQRAPLPGAATGLSSGYDALDQALPDAGWPTHDLMEILVCQWGSGELKLLQPALATLSQQRRWLAWVSPPWQPYAPGLQGAGIALERVLVIRTQQQRDTLWAMEECLQSACCSAVLGWPVNPTPTSIRRLQRAAQQGNSWGILLRPQEHAQQPSPAPLRLEIAPTGQDLRVRIIKRRGSWGSDWLTCSLAKPVMQPSPTLQPTLQAAVNLAPTTPPIQEHQGQDHAVDLPVFPTIATRQLSGQPRRAGLGD
jgi:cell division inhibitor SulA